MQCHAMQCNRNEQNALQSIAMQCKAKHSKAKQCKATQSNATQSKAMQINASKARQSIAKQRNANQSNAKQRIAMQSIAKQSIAKHSKSLHVTPFTLLSKQLWHSLSEKKKKHLIGVTPGSSTVCFACCTRNHGNRSPNVPQIERIIVTSFSEENLLLRFAKMAFSSSYSVNTCRFLM